MIRAQDGCQLMANDRLPDDVVAILLRVNDCGRHQLSPGDYLCLTRKDLEEGVGLCGVRSDAVIILDPTLPEELKREVFLPLMAATAKLKQQVFTGEQP